MAGVNELGDPVNFVAVLPIGEGATGDEKLANAGLAFRQDGDKMVIDDVAYDSAAQTAGLDWDQEVMRVLKPVSQPTKYPVREETAIAAERARLGEAWSLLQERVEFCRRQDAAAQAERQEALRFAKETRDSVKREAQEVMDQLDADREALEAETASRHEELAAAQRNFAAESEGTRASLKEQRELLDAREGHLGLREAELKQRGVELQRREEQVQVLEKDQAIREEQLKAREGRLARDETTWTERKAKANAHLARR